MLFTTGTANARTAIGTKTSRLRSWGPWGRSTARATCSSWGVERAEVIHTDGELSFEKPKGFYDRFVAIHVFVLLPFDQIEEGLTEVARDR